MHWPAGKRVSPSTSLTYVADTPGVGLSETAVAVTCTHDDSQVPRHQLCEQQQVAAAASSNELWRTHVSAAASTAGLPHESVSAPVVVAT